MKIRKIQVKVYMSRTLDPNPRNKVLPGVSWTALEHNSVLFQSKLLFSFV